jgi:hypothetical protein
MHGNDGATGAGSATSQTPLHRKRGAIVTLAMTGLLIGGGALLIGPHAVAQSQESRRDSCSNRTLRGSYAFAIDGTIIAGPNRLLLRGLAMTEFDGRGNLTQVDFTTINGVPAGASWRPAVGSYDVDSDCTGTMQIIPADGSPTLNLKLVVADHGRTVHNIVIGNATGAIGTKVD